LTRFSPYRKAIVAVIASVLSWLAVAYVPDGHVDRAEWLALGVGLAGALGVYGVTNDEIPEPEPEPAQPAAETPVLGP
jgi:hypothetical protein